MKERDIRVEAFFDCVEDILAHSRNRRFPPEEVARRVRFRYPSPMPFLQSNEYLLRQTGMSNADAFYFWMLPGVARTMLQESFGDKPRLNTLSRMVEYLRPLFIGIRVEYFYSLFLDSHGALIRAVMMGRGSADTAIFDLEELLSRLVDCDAKALVLCHNHPGGTLMPSDEDLQCTLRTMAATAAINVPLLDHIIMTEKRPVSIRESGYIPAALWTRQDPRKKLVREWLDTDLI